MNALRSEMQQQIDVAHGKGAKTAQKISEESQGEEDEGAEAKEESSADSEAKEESSAEEWNHHCRRTREAGVEAREAILQSPTADAETGATVAWTPKWSVRDSRTSSAAPAVRDSRTSSAAPANGRQSWPEKSSSSQEWPQQRPNRSSSSHARFQKGGVEHRVTTSRWIPKRIAAQATTTTPPGKEEQPAACAGGEAATPPQVEDDQPATCATGEAATPPEGEEEQLESCAGDPSLC